MLEATTIAAAAEPDRIAGEEPTRYSLADVLAIIPSTKRSQVELLVRTGRITPAWPSPGTGHDRAFDHRNLFAIAIANEVIALGYVGQRLTQYFKTMMRVVLDPGNAVDADFLLLIPGPDRPPIPWPCLVSAAKLGEIFVLANSGHVINVRGVLLSLRVAIRQFHENQEGTDSR